MKPSEVVDQVTLKRAAEQNARASDQILAIKLSLVLEYFDELYAKGHIPVLPSFYRELLPPGTGVESP